MKRNLLYLATLFFLLLVTGIFWGTWFTLTRSIDEFSADEFIHIGKVIISNVAVAMRFIVIISLLLIIASLWIGKRKSGFLYGSFSLAFFLAVLLMTLLVLVPIDNAIKTWSPASLPANWEALRERWAVWHALRTFASLAGFILFAFFALSEASPFKRKYKLEKRNKGFWI